MADSSAKGFNRSAIDELPTQHRPLWQDASKRFLRNRLSVVGLAIVSCIALLAIFAELLAPFPYDFARFDRVLLLPFQNPDHPLGTDEVGRDYLSRLIFGARTSLTVSLVVQGIAVLIGVPVGALAGYRGGVFDFAVTRVIDVMTAFPSLLFAILNISILGGTIVPLALWSVVEGEPEALLGVLLSRRLPSTRRSYRTSGGVIFVVKINDVFKTLSDFAW